MELKVWVEGIERIVCGVTENTTCQDVVYALAHATGKTGRFTLIERWRNNERLLAPQEQPLKILTKWGEYSNDVQFILQRSSVDSSKIIGQTKPKVPDSLLNFMPSTSSPLLSLNDSFDARPTQGLIPDRNKDIRKSLTFSGSHHVQGLSELRRGENIGIVKGVPQVKASVDALDDSYGSGSSKSKLLADENCTNQDTRSPVKREAPPYRNPPCPALSPQRSLPPYRDPPPPIQSPSRGTPPQSGLSSLQEVTVVDTSANKAKMKRNLMKEFKPSSSNDGESHHESMEFNSQYRDLIRLVNYQREKLSSQQAELTKFDAEIVFWENKTREQQHQLEFLVQESVRMEKASRIAEDQIRLLCSVEEESEIVRQQEKTLKSELTLLRSKLANCETELLQCKNKIRLLLEDLQVETRAQQQEVESRQDLERGLLIEVERLQRELEQAQHATELSAQCSENLKREVASLEASIAEKKRQVERLVAEMKEANLQSLAIAPTEELKNLLEGPHKPGSTRKMIGSPRQLENAVPTSKNPHGVWV